LCYFYKLFFLLAFTKSIKLEGDFNRISDVQLWLLECNFELKKFSVFCVDVSSGSVILRIGSELQANLDSVLQEITENGLTLPTFGSYPLFIRKFYPFFFLMFLKFPESNKFIWRFFFLCLFSL
jgi:hypothetical protein